MKTIRVTYTPSGIQISPDAVLGYQGDHKAAELLITPPDVPDVSFWRLDWQLPGGTTHSTGALTPVDGAIWYMIPSGLTAEEGYVNAQLKAFRQDGAEIVMQMGSAKLQFFVPPSLPGGDIPAEDVEPLAEALADCRDATSEALSGAQEAREAAAQLPQYVEQAQGFAEDAEESKDGAAQTLSDLLAMMGVDIATLTGGKLTPSQIPAIAVTDTFVVASEAAMLALDAQTGDVCIRTDESKTYILQGGNPAALTDWQQLQSPTNYADQAGHANTADNAANADRINNKRIVGMTQEQYDSAVLDPDTFYFVTPDGE